MCVMQLVPTWCILNSLLVTRMGSPDPEMSECSKQGPSSNTIVYLPVTGSFLAAVEGALT